MKKTLPVKAPSKGSQTRQRIVDEGLQLFAVQGVEATSIREIAAKVGISEPAVYRHFPSKAALVWHIFSDGYTSLAQALDEAQQSASSVRGKIDRIIEIYCTLHDTNEALFRFLFLTQHGQLSRMTEDSPSPLKVVLRVLSDGIEAGEIPRRDPQLLNAMFVGLVTQPAVFHIYGRLTGKMSSYRRTLSDAAWAAISFKQESRS